MNNAEVAKTADIWGHAINIMKTTDIIENATVYCKRVSRRNDGGGEDEYSGKDMELVVNKALSVLQSIDKYQSPSMNKAWQDGEGCWHCNVKWYGLGD